MLSATLPHHLNRGSVNTHMMSSIMTSKNRKQRRQSAGIRCRVM